MCARYTDKAHCLPAAAVCRFEVQIHVRVAGVCAYDHLGKGVGIHRHPVHGQQLVANRNFLAQVRWACTGAASKTMVDVYRYKAVSV
jgi:hypothetical protein